MLEKFNIGISNDLINLRHDPDGNIYLSTNMSYSVEMCLLSS